MSKPLKDLFKVNLILTALFYTGIAASAFVLFRLPQNLMISYGYEAVFTTLYLVIGVTFILGIVVISLAMRYKKELVVYRERTNEMNQADLEASENKGTITLDGVKTSLNSAKNEKETFQLGLETICQQLKAGQGAAYKVHQDGTSRYAELLAGFAVSISETSSVRYNFGEGLIGQAAASSQQLYVDEVPEGYLKIISGLGSASPRYLLITPVKNQNSVLGVLEVASFSPITPDQRKFVEQSAEMMASKLSA